MNRAWVDTAFVHLTDADGSLHLVSPALHEEGLTSGRGQFAVVCGKIVFTGSLAAEDGRHCRLCWVTVDATRP